MWWKTNLFTYPTGTCLFICCGIMQKTEKMYDLRNQRKKSIEFWSKMKRRRDRRKGEFWRYFEGMNIGNEISKNKKFVRVCFIIENNLGNWLFLVIPLTTKYHKRMEKYYIKLENYADYGLKECRMILNQMKLIDWKRLSDKASLHRPLIWLTKKVKYSYRKLILNNKKTPWS